MSSRCSEDDRVGRPPRMNVLSLWSGSQHSRLTIPCPGEEHEKGITRVLRTPRGFAQARKSYSEASIIAGLWNANITDDPLFNVFHSSLSSGFQRLCLKRDNQSRDHLDTGAMSRAIAPWMPSRLNFSRAPGTDARSDNTQKVHESKNLDGRECLSKNLEGVLASAAHTLKV